MKFKSIGFKLALIGLSVDYLSAKQSVQYIVPDDLYSQIGHVSDKNSKKFHLVNVLPRYIRSDCTIADSVNIPIHLLDKKLKNSNKWSRSSKVVVYCTGEDSSYLSRYAYEIFKNNGFADVMVLKGGIKSWRQQGYPVTGKCAMGYLQS